MTYPDFYANYVHQVPEGYTIDRALGESAALLTEYLHGVPERRGGYRYAPGKWTIKQSAQHVIDTERIFSYRILRLARFDTTPLPGFEQNDYAAVAPAEDQSLVELIAAFITVRAATRSLVAPLSDDSLDFVGTVSGGAMECRALCYICAGHVYHHNKLFRERYQ